MCLGIIGQIETVDNHEADALVLGAKVRINIDLIEEPKRGDFVLIHTGFAIQKVNYDEAMLIDNAIREMIEEEEND